MIKYFATMHLVVVLNIHRSSILKPYERSISISFVIICKISHDNITSHPSELDFIKLNQALDRCLFEIHSDFIVNILIE